ncbi:MAG: hypothetical protein VW226_01750 [Rhodospirillaceae bacterium]|jgi:hypothetical protein
MFSNNPFAQLSTSVSPDIMQSFVIVMILFVVFGTLFDVIHKKSAHYFFRNWRKVKDQGQKDVNIAGLAIQTAVIDVATSAEFCNQKRRIAHLLGMYGFVIYVIATCVLVFSYPTPATETPSVWVQLWYLGAAMVCFGGYWFWFFIRVDVASEGHSPFRIIRADFFVLSLLATCSFGLLWAIGQNAGWSFSPILLALYLISAVLLFGGVPWSKFSHMFFKPAAALQKRIETENGTRRNLPPPADKPATLGSVERVPRNY